MFVRTTQKLLSGGVNLLIRVMRKPNSPSGTCYQKGEGVRQDYAEAVKWLRKAADQGDADAQYILGLMYMYEKGVPGVPKNSVEAYKWLNLASANGQKEAAEARAFVERKMTPGQIAEAQRLSATRQPKSSIHADESRASPGQTKQSSPASTEIPLIEQDGVYILPVKINGVISLNFILDSGASEVTIPADVALTLLRAGTIGQSDFLPGKSYQLADGSKLDSSRFIIRELDLGGVKITQVPAAITPATGSLLLGQSFLGRLESWSLDNKRLVLIIRGIRLRGKQLLRLTLQHSSQFALFLFRQSPAVPNHFAYLGLRDSEGLSKIGLTVELRHNRNLQFLIDHCLFLP